jgi:hypothetical protein
MITTEEGNDECCVTQWGAGSFPSVGKGRNADAACTFWVERVVAIAVYQELAGLAASHVAVDSRRQELKLCPFKADSSEKQTF